MQFDYWILAVQVEAKRVLGHNNVEWLIGDAKDMRTYFDDGDSPAEYVQQLVEHIG